MAIRRKTSDSDSKKQLVEDIKGNLLHEPPKATLRRAKALFSGFSSPRTLADETFRLIFDSSMQPRFAGLRSVASQNVRRLLFDLLDGMAQLDLEISRISQDEARVAGQILPPLEDCSVTARCGGRSKVARAEPTGEFIFPSVRLRESALFIDLNMPEADAIHIGPIEMADRSTDEDCDPGEQ